MATRWPRRAWNYRQSREKILVPFDLWMGHDRPIITLCRHRMKRIDAAIAVVVRNGRILICQRKSQDTFGGYWEFPGGKCEPGETLEQCLCRELREEVDITAQPLAKLSVISHNYPNVQLTLHPYLCEHVSGEPKLIECQKALWVEAGELRNYRFPPANESLLQEIVDRLGPSKGLSPSKGLGPSKGLSPQTNAPAPDDDP